MSIDAELERQVAAEAELLEKEEEERMRKEEAKKAEEPTPTFSDIVRKWEGNFKICCVKPENKRKYLKNCLISKIIALSSGEF